MIIFLPNFIYSDDILALMRKHYGRPIVCHLRWGRRGEPTCQRYQRARMGLVEFGISMRHLDSSTWHLHAASQGVGRLAAGVSGLRYYVHIYFIRSPVFPLFLAFIVCISVNAAFYTLLSKFYDFNVHIALLLSLVTFASTFYLYIIFLSFVPS